MLGCMAAGSCTLSIMLRTCGPASSPLSSPPTAAAKELALLLGANMGSAVGAFRARFLGCTVHQDRRGSSGVACNVSMSPVQACMHLSCRARTWWSASPEPTSPIICENSAINSSKPPSLQGPHNPGILSQPPASGALPPQRTRVLLPPPCAHLLRWLLCGVSSPDVPCCSLSSPPLLLPCSPLASF